MGSVDDAKETNQIAVPHQNEEEERVKFEKKYTVVYVLGGPGAGKSTQCSNISKQIGFKHLSIGDLLREASKSDAENGSVIERMKKEGESVPTDLTMAILMKAIDQSRNNKFLLDGFPRDEEIRAAFEEAGRVDDNPERLRKCFKRFEQCTVPVIEYYRSKGKVYQIDAGKSKEEIFESIRGILRLVDAEDGGPEKEMLKIEL